MIKINKKQIETAIGKRLNTEIKSIGVDTASRAGICFAHADKTHLYLDGHFIHVQSTDIYFKYNQLIKSFRDSFAEVARNIKNKESKYVLIIEDTYFGKNINVLKMISRMGMIVYMIGQEKGIDDIRFIYPTTSRKNVGIKANMKKKLVHNALSEMLKIELPDEDIADAYILAINGLLIENTLI